MAFCRVVLPLLVLSIIGCYGSESTSIPVYMFGELLEPSFKSYPLAALSTLKFEEIVKSKVADDPLLLVFVEETLSVEDFSLKNAAGKTSFPYLHDNIEEALYFPAVHRPLKAIHLLADPLRTEHITVTGLSEGITPKSSEENGRVIFINFEDALEDESRSEMLQRHDKFMQETIEKMPENEKIVVIYTARKPSWTIPVTHSRSRRAVETRNRTLALNGLRLYANKIILSSNNNSVTLSELTNHNTNFNNDTSMNTTLTFENQSITLNFYQKGGYWFFDYVTLTQATLTEELFPNDEVFAIMGFSYRCKQVVSFTSINETVTYTLSFEDLKIQPFFEPTNSTQVFGDSFNCVGFFSAPIWAGLFVVFILLIITFYGIMMMLDIRTMDRFDDPKGKTITINAGE